MTQSDWTSAIPIAGANGACSWNEFDPIWYAQRYLGGAEHADVAFAAFLKHGIAECHDPNPFFSERWMRRVNPDLIDQAHPTAFSACLAGKSPIGAMHWLFDADFFREVAADLTPDRMAKDGFVDSYDQFLRLGHREGRRPSVYFDPIFYLTQLGAEDVGEAMRLSPFHHYLIRHSLDGVEIATSPYFDPDWYLRQNPQAVVRLARRASLSALDDFLFVANDTTPNEHFNERNYLSAHADVAEDAARRRSPKPGYMHFIRFGAKQGRTVPGFHWNEELARIFGGDEPFGKFLANGAAARDPEDIAKELFRQEAADLAQHAAIDPIDFHYDGDPEVSVLMVLYNQFELVMGAIASLRANSTRKMDLILVDSGSSDEIASIETYVTGARIIRPGENIGFLRGCNLALQHAKAPYTLYLNTDVLLAPNALDNAVRRLDVMPGAAAVGGKVVRSHGLLQEAGNIIFSDGSTIGRLRDQSPLSPEANYLCDVDYVSGAFMLLRTEPARALKGFDPRYAPAYYEETDLCTRLAQQGWQIVYDPAIVVRHHEYGSAASVDHASKQMKKNQGVFRKAHARWIKDLPDSAHRRSAELVHRPPSWRGPGGKRILYIDDTIPRRRLGSGFVRSNDIVNALATLGHAVTVFPANGTKESIVALRREFAPEVELIHDRDFRHMTAFMDARGNDFDLVWVGRAHNLDRLAPVLRSWPSEKRPRVLLDSEAVFACRDAAKARLAGASFDLAASVRNEFRNADLIEAIVAVNEGDARLLESVLERRALEVGTMVPSRLGSRTFEDRDGFLVVGAIHAQDAPNLDALNWLADHVVDRLEAALGFPPKIIVAGYVAPGIELARFENDARFQMLGMVDDLAPLYDSARAFLAPTRVAAGAPYKIYEAASFGLPNIMTDLLGGQMQWRDGEEARIAAVNDGIAFASAAAEVYNDSGLWARLRDKAAHSVGALTEERYREQIQRAVSAGTWAEPVPAVRRIKAKQKTKKR